VLRAASGGMTRRLVPTVVVFVLLAAASAAALLGLALVTNADVAFFKGFAAHRGADMVVTIDSAKVTPAQLAATSHLPGVTKAAGPYPTVTISLAAEGTQGGPAGYSSPGSPGHGPGPAHDARGSGRAGNGGRQWAVTGRASRAGPLEDLTVQSGHWLDGPGQIVLANYDSPPFPLSSKVVVTSAPGKPLLTVVGTAGSPGRFGDAWVTPSDITALRLKNAPAMVQMLYTFTKAGNALRIGADVAALKAALPVGAVTGLTPGSAQRPRPVPNPRSIRRSWLRSC
jgi:putative ABC transport system permease protein